MFTSASSGAAAAAGIIGVDFGKLILYGLVVAIPATAIGYVWANYAGKKIKTVVEEDEIHVAEDRHRPSVIKAFLPVIIPVVLIALKSFLAIENSDENSLLNFFISWRSCYCIINWCFAGL